MSLIYYIGASCCSRLYLVWWEYMIDIFVSFMWWLTISLLSTKHTTNYLVKSLSTKGPWHMELEIHVILLWDRHKCFKYMRYKLIEQKHSTSIIILIVSNQYLRPTILFCKICDLLKWTTPNLRVVIMHKIVGIKLSRYDEFLE
jgi:hypothetical protein